jgi:hypothetical protein
MGTVEGTFSALQAGQWSITQANGDVLRLDPADLTGVERWEEKRNTVKGALIGGGFGLAGGLLMKLAISDECDSGGEVCESLLGWTGDAIVVTGTVGGLLTGSLIGTLIKTGHWAPALLPRITLARPRVVAQETSGARGALVREEARLWFGWTVPVHF